MPTSVSVVGDGKSDRRNTSALIQDFVDGYAAGVSFVLPVTEPWFTDSVRHVADWVVEHQSTFVSLTFLADSHDIVDLSDYENIPVTEVEDMAVALSDTDVVIVAWQDDPDFEGWIEDILKTGTKVLDLTDGLYPIEYTPDADDKPTVVDDVTEPTPEPEPVQEPVQEEKPKPARRSRAKANAEKAQEKQEQPADEGQTLVPTQAVSWPPNVGDVINSPEFLDSLIGEVERRVMDRLRSALA